MENKICSKCNATLTNAQKFCPYCGTEYKKPSPVCQKCGVPLEEGQKFCHLCGAKFDNCCIKCGAELKQGNRFCSNCGEPVKKDSAFKQNIEKLRQDKRLLISIIKKGAILLLALFMLISIFLPFTKTEAQYNFEIKLNAFDGVVIPFDAMINKTNEELKESSLYIRTEKLKEKLEEKYGKYWDETENSSLLSRYAKNEYRLLLRNELNTVSFSQILTAILCLGYIALAITSFVLSLLSFLSLFINVRDFTNTAIILIAFAPALLIVLMIAYNVGKICFAPITAIVLAVILLAFLAIYRIFFKEKEAINKRNAIKKGIAFACCITLLFLAFAPIFKVNVSTVFKGSESEQKASTKLDNSIFDTFDTYKDILDSFGDDLPLEAEIYFDIISGFTKQDFNKGKVNGYVDNIIFFSTIGFGAENFGWVFALGSPLIIIAMLMAAILIWNNTLNVVCNISLSKKLINIAKIIMLISVMLVFILSLVISSISSYNCASLDINFKTSITFELVAFVIFSVVTALIPMTKKQL